MSLFTTDELQMEEDFVYEIPSAPRIKVTNNPRYSTFRQNHFTAGDEDQFMQYWQWIGKSTVVAEPSNLHPDLSVHENTQLELYSNICKEEILFTFRYLSEKFKKGIFLQIQDHPSKSTFLPFSKADFQNEWSDKIRINPHQFKDFSELVRYTNEKDGREFLPHKIHKNKRAWYGNNGLVRFEYPISEGESGVNIMHDMFRTLIRERIVPPWEGFLNKRDFPLLKKDRTESYDAFFGTRTRLLSHQYEKMAPILSMTTTKEHADIPIPTWYDWSIASYWHDKRMFGKDYFTFTSMEEFDAVLWETKIPTAIFRGASTGQGTRLSNNIRLQWSAESILQKKDRDGIPFLDVGITKWNLRPRKHPRSPYIETIIVEDMPFQLTEPLTPLEQCRYKYILHLPGHSEAYRLTLELFMGSVILYYPTPYTLWYFSWLKPWVHFVPLEGSTSDLYRKIRWCKRHDKECCKIASRAKEFARKYLTREGMLDYLQKMLWRIQQTTGPVVAMDASFQRGLRRNLDLYENCHLLYEKALSDLLRQGNAFSSENNNSFWMEGRQLECFRCATACLSSLESLREGRTTSLYTSSLLPSKVCLKKSVKRWKQ